MKFTFSILIAFVIVSCSDEVLVPESTGSIHGIVVDSAQYPIPFMSISTNPPTSQTFTRADGKYLISSVLPGVYVVDAKHVQLGEGTASVRVLAGKSIEANIIISSHRVGEGLIQGKVTDSSNIPIAGVLVTTLPETITVSTDSYGMFYMPQITKGSYTLIAEGSGLVRHTEPVSVSEARTTYVEIKMSSNPSFSFDALVAYYPFEGSGHDYSNGGLHLVMNDPSYTPSRFSDGSLALLANGATTKASTPHGEMHNLGSMSISLWIKAHRPVLAQEQSMAILSHYVVASANGFTLFFVGYDLEWLYGSGGNDYTYCRLDNAGVTDGAWHSIIATAGSTGSALYIDGKKVASNAAVGLGSPSSVCPLEIADISSGTATPFHGAIDDVRIYSKILTNQEILLLSNEK